MISQLKIQNFKCFREPSHFEFSALNLLTGINGRGKSSILQSILLISQSIDGLKDFKKLTLNGRHINLGNFDDVKNSETPRSEDIIINIKIGDLLNGIYRFRENENDELTALLNEANIEYKQNESIDTANSILDSIISIIKSNSEINKETIPISVPQLVFNYVLSKIHYISADRLGPVKYVDKTTFENSEFISVGPKGEHTINILAKPNLPLVNESLYLGKDAKSVIQQTEEWLNYILEGAKIKVEGLEKASSVLWLLINNKSNAYRYKPTNIGFGYSYILPLIVSGLIAQPGDIVIVENPEAHLHPRAQSRIAEFFARVASGNVQVFIESHSEHILNGLRISTLNPEININSKSVSIHYFDENFTSKRLSIDNKGKIANWPDGFFDQQEIDLASIFKYNR